MDDGRLEKAAKTFGVQVPDGTWRMAELDVYVFYRQEPSSKASILEKKTGAASRETEVRVRHRGGADSTLNLKLSEFPGC